MCGSDFEYDARGKAMVWSALGGTFFGIGWWIFLNACALHNSSNDPIPFSFYLPLVGQLVSFLMINLPAWSAIQGDDVGAYENMDRVACINRGILSFGAILQFSCVAASVYIFAGVYGQEDDANFKVNNVGDGAQIFLGNLMVFLATWFMRWANVPPQE